MLLKNFITYLNNINYYFRLIMNKSYLFINIISSRNNFNFKKQKAIEVDYDK